MGVCKENRIQSAHSMLQKIRNVHTGTYIKAGIPRSPRIHHKGPSVRRYDKRGVSLPHINKMHAHLRCTKKRTQSDEKNSCKYGKSYNPPSCSPNNINKIFLAFPVLKPEYNNTVI